MITLEQLEEQYRQCNKNILLIAREFGENSPDYRGMLHERDKIVEQINKLKDTYGKIEEGNANSYVGAPAPRLEEKGDKWNHIGPYDKDGKIGCYYYQLPMPLIDYIFSSLSGKAGLLIKIMTVLIGTAKGFRVSEKWICDRIGIDSSNRNNMTAYRRARKTLCEMNWLILDKENHKIYVNYDFLWEQVLSNKNNCETTNYQL